MYSVVRCRHCRKFWIIDDKSVRVKCPWCGRSQSSSALFSAGRSSELDDARAILKEVSSQGGEGLVPATSTGTRYRPNGRDELIKYIMDSLTKSQGGFTKDMLADACTENNLNIQAIDLETIIQKLLKDGRLYEPRPDFYCWIE